MANKWLVYSFEAQHQRLATTVSSTGISEWCLGCSWWWDWDCLHVRWGLSTSESARAEDSIVRSSCLCAGWRKGWFSTQSHYNVSLWLEPGTQRHPYKITTVVLVRPASFTACGISKGIKEMMCTFLVHTAHRVCLSQVALHPRIGQSRAIPTGGIGPFSFTPPWAAAVGGAHRPVRTFHRFQNICNEKLKKMERPPVTRDW